MSSGVLPCCSSYSLEPKETFTSRGNAERSSLLLAIQMIGRGDGGSGCFMSPARLCLSVLSHQTNYGNFTIRCQAGHCPRDSVTPLRCGPRRVPRVEDRNAGIDEIGDVAGDDDLVVNG